MVYALQHWRMPQESELPVTISEVMRRPRAAFVTLKKSDQLRGCIGDIFPQRPLYKSVIVNAINACVNDKRFLPVSIAECNDITIEISAAELKALLGTPKELIPAPGAGKVLEVFSVFVYMDAGLTAFDFGDPVQVKQGVSVWADVPTSVMNSVTDSAAHFSKTSLNCPINTSIVFQAQNSNATVGNGICKINIRYRTIDLQSF